MFHVKQKEGFGVLDKGIHKQAPHGLMPAEALHRRAVIHLHKCNYSNYKKNNEDD